MLTFSLPALAQPGPGTDADNPEIGGPPPPGPEGPGGPGFGGPGGGRMAHQRMGAFGRMGHLSAKWLLEPENKTALGITPEQATKIQKADDDAEKAIIAQDAKIREARLDLQKLMREDKPDREKVLSQIDVIGKDMTDRQKMDVTRMLDIRDALTPEQVKKAKEMAAAKRKAEAPARQGRKGARRALKNNPPAENPPPEQ
jgi:Spy/CpxP family protein refolding chaperone